MMKNYVLMSAFMLFVGIMSYAQGETIFLDFEGTAPLDNLPTGVTNVNSSNTIKIKNDDSKVYAPIPNEVQSDPDVDGEQELFLDFQGYLKLDVTPSTGFSLVYDYRRNDLNDDWWLGLLSFLGEVAGDESPFKYEKLLIRKWNGELNVAGTDITSAENIVSFNTNYHVALTSSSTGDMKLYIDNVLILDIPNATTGWDIHNWTDAGVLISFKGQSYDGTTLTPEQDYETNARDTRVFVDNIALFERELSASEVDALYQNGNSTLSTKDLTLANTLKTYPNPVKNILNFSSPDVKTVEIYNLLGAKVMSKQTSNSRVDLSSLNTGTYIVNCLDADGRYIKTVKTVKL